MRAEVYWIDGPWTGRLAILPHPRGGEWLVDEVQSLRAVGMDILVSTLEREETRELELMREPEICHAQGIESVSFPIEDRGIPSEKSTLELARRLESKLARVAMWASTAGRVSGGRPCWRLALWGCRELIHKAPFKGFKRRGGVLSLIPLNSATGSNTLSNPT